MSYQNNYRNNKPSYNQVPTLSKDFVVKGFTELREELMLNEARDIAKVFTDSKLSNSQLRAFFNEIKALQNKINKDEKLFEQNYPFILMLKSKAEYKYRNGQGAKITKPFRDFINESIDYIKDNKSVKTFDNFCILFETIVGYYYGFGGEKLR